MRWCLRWFSGNFCNAASGSSRFAGCQLSSDACTHDISQAFFASSGFSSVAEAAAEAYVWLVASYAQMHRPSARRGLRLRPTRPISFFSSCHIDKDKDNENTAALLRPRPHDDVETSRPSRGDSTLCTDGSFPTSTDENRLHQQKHSSGTTSKRQRIHCRITCWRIVLHQQSCRRRCLHSRRHGRYERIGITIE